MRVVLAVVLLACLPSMEAFVIHGEVVLDPPLVDFTTGDSVQQQVTFRGWSDCPPRLPFQSPLSGAVWLMRFSGPANYTVEPTAFGPILFEDVLGSVPPRQEAHASFRVLVNRTSHGENRSIDERNTWAWGVGGSCDAQFEGNLTEFRILGAPRPARDPDAAGSLGSPWPSWIALLALVGAAVARRRKPPVPGRPSEP